jgi:hypothetical protein
MVQLSSFVTIFSWCVMTEKSLYERLGGVSAHKNMTAGYYAMKEKHSH